MIEKTVKYLLQKYPQGGTEYFNALDEAIGSNTTLMLALLELANVDDSTLIVTQGSFGDKIWELACDVGETGPDCIRFKNSFRRNQYHDHIKVEMFMGTWRDKVVILDDSCYSKKTLNGMYNWMSSYMSMVPVGMYVVYDGAIENNNPRVESLYRYYNFHKKKRKGKRW